MRYIHPVGVSEKFVASGIYRYYKNDEPTGLVEEWTVHEQPDGAWFIRVDKDGRFFDGRSELIETYRNPNGQIERFDITAYGGKDDAVKQFKGTYTIENGYLYIGRTLNNGERIQSEMMLPDQYIVNPGGYLFFGWAIPALVENAPLSVVMRYGFHDTPEESFVTGMVYPTLTFYQEGALTISGRTLPAACYISGESKPEGAVNYHRYWIGEHNIFFKHESDDLRVQLDRYAHRPEKN